MPFGKHPGLIVHAEHPFNAEPPLALLRNSFVTPGELCYVRNHGDVPAVDAGAYRLSVGGLVDRPRDLSLDDLRESFPKVTVAATLSCAGNRREQLLGVAPIPGELPWRDGAIANAYWAGVALRDVLAAAGVAPEGKHVSFEGLDEADEGGHAVTFGGSIPLAKATRLETILAYEMNGETLPGVHGFPLRVVVPGYIGARSVKWLARITVDAEPSSNYYQARSYRLPPAGSTREEVDWAKAIALGEVSVNSAICRPARDEIVPPGPVRVDGWAIAGAGRLVERVDVSTDGGATWIAADLENEGDLWTWRFWSATLELEPGIWELVARASDSAGNTQPEDPRTTWNLKGYVNNAWHRVRFAVGERRTRGPS
jgi:sulfite oxidase